MAHTVSRLVAILISSLVLVGLLMPDGPAGWAFIPQAVAQTPATGVAQAEPGKWRVWLPRVIRSSQDYRDPQAHPLGIEIPGGLAAGDATRRRLVQSLGASWFRWNRVSWARIEKPRSGPQEPAQYDFSGLDSSMAAVGASGLTPIVIVGDNPDWTGGNGQPLDAEVPVGVVGPEVAALRDFMVALVSRYKDPPYNVKYWEMYNEPDNVNVQNSGAQGGLWGGHGEKYARMLQVVYPAVKAADPNAKVVLGGLTMDDFTTEGGNNDPNFLDDVLRTLSSGGGPGFDVMNFHYYPEYAWRWNQIGKDSGHGPGIAGKAGRIRDRLAAFGFHSLPLICTEFGLSSASDRWAEPPADVYSSQDPRLRLPTSPEEQGRFVVRNLARGLSKGIAVMIWYPLDDSGPPGIPPNVNYFAYHGLVDHQMSQKSAFGVYQLAAQQLAGAQFVRAGTGLELGTGDAEGYLFRMPDGHLQWVIWSATGLSIQVSLSTLSATIVEKTGDSRTVTSLNPLVSYITFEVSPSPVYVVLPLGQGG
ncbi:MAG: cellulase family glycosylhydrolase [Chloroflexi bacterium]|nr:cellulase family glycosylhydrolase [Chloroflexota bacterium]